MILSDSLPRERFGPALTKVIDAVLQAWPEHIKFLTASLKDRSAEVLATSEVIADLLLKVSERFGRPIEHYTAAYRYLCEKIVYPEEIYFRREGRYRLSTFEEADREVYSNAPMMAQYMDGLFVSDALWLNHASAMNDFASAYLPSLTPGGSHLEIGPGHGMLLHLALKAQVFDDMSAWDVSETSLLHAGHVLEALGEKDRVTLTRWDLYADEALAQNRGRFDTVVLSEVLEHLERPKEALEIIGKLLKPGGTVWINVPANGPAPDHLFLVKSPAEVVALVETAGLKVEREAAFPLAGSNLDRALRQELPISCCVTASRIG